ncbi:MAG: four helix bundle protein [Planctomycetes bacterium]|nr:four helix bundle protein [Planctomycetota bacterium]
MQDFRNLKVWQKAHSLVLAVYRATKGFPKEELFSLTQQMRRSAMSVPTNIAEGCGRSTNADFARFLWIANGSAKELDYQTLLAHDLGYLDEAAYAELSGPLAEVKRMLAGLIQSVSA